MDFSNVWDGIIDSVLSVLPTSPFADFIGQFQNLPFLGYLNWFFPVGGVLTVMGVWLAAIALFYLYSILMRWIKMIGD